jgi:hypothetical protein
MVQLKEFTGSVISINDLQSGGYEAGCAKMIALKNDEGALVNFILTPATYVVNLDMITVGDTVKGYYDANAPAILIYPPQYQALIMAKLHRGQNVYIGYFNRELTSNNQLKLNIQPNTPIITANGQAFTDDIRNRNLIVIYGPSTKSIPAQTTPYKIIVLC